MSNSVNYDAVSQYTLDTVDELDTRIGGSDGGTRSCLFLAYLVHALIALKRTLWVHPR
jgi:hypothetical protein